MSIPQVNPSPNPNNLNEPAVNLTTTTQNNPNVHLASSISPASSTPIISLNTPQSATDPQKAPSLSILEYSQHLSDAINLLTQTLQDNDQARINELILNHTNLNGLAGEIANLRRESNSQYTLDQRSVDSGNSIISSQNAKTTQLNTLLSAPNGGYYKAANDLQTAADDYNTARATLYPTAPTGPGQPDQAIADYNAAVTNYNAAKAAYNQVAPQVASLNQSYSSFEQAAQAYNAGITTLNAQRQQEFPTLPQLPLITGIPSAPFGSGVPSTITDSDISPYSSADPIPPTQPATALPNLSSNSVPGAIATFPAISSTNYQNIVSTLSISAINQLLAQQAVVERRIEDDRNFVLSDPSVTKSKRLNPSSYNNNLTNLLGGGGTAASQGYLIGLTLKGTSPAQSIKMFAESNFAMALRQTMLGLSTADQTRLAQSLTNSVVSILLRGSILGMSEGLNYILPETGRLSENSPVYSIAQLLGSISQIQSFLNSDQFTVAITGILTDGSPEFKALSQDQQNKIINDVKASVAQTTAALAGAALVQKTAPDLLPQYTSTLNVSANPISASSTGNQPSTGAQPTNSVNTANLNEINNNNSAAFTSSTQNALSSNGGATSQQAQTISGQVTDSVNNANNSGGISSADLNQILTQILVSSGIADIGKALEAITSNINNFVLAAQLHDTFVNNYRNSLGQASAERVASDLTRIVLGSYVQGQTNANEAYNESLLDTVKRHSADKAKDLQTQQIDAFQETIDAIQGNPTQLSKFFDRLLDPGHTAFIGPMYSGRTDPIDTYKSPDSSGISA